MPGWRQHADEGRSRSPARRLGQYGPELFSWLRSYCWGSIAAAQVVRNADAKVQGDSRRNLRPDRCIQRLANSIRNLGNAERLVNSLMPQSLFPQRLAVPDSLIEIVMPPYAMFHWLRELNPAKFHICFGAKPDGLEQWWQDLRNRPVVGERFWTSHPWLRDRSPSDLKFYVPLMLFDDAGPTTKVHSAYARCFYSPLGKGSDIDTRFIIGTGLKSDVEDKSWNLIIDSFQKLAGPLDDKPWGGVLLFFGNDMEYAANDLGMSNYNSIQCCSFCDANNGTLPFNDLSRWAKWRATIRSNEEFLAHLRRPLHPLAAYGLLSKYTNRLDMLHLLDHHGVTSHICANVIHTVVSTSHGLLVGDTKQHRLDFLNDDIKAYNSATKVTSRMPPLRWTNIVADADFPELKGNFVKAANTRCLVPFIKNLAERQVRRFPTAEHKHMYKCADSLAELYDILYNASCFLTREQVALVQHHCTRLGENYQTLAVLTMEAGARKWAIRPKLHYLIAHLPEQAKLINPVYCQGYRSESMVGKVTAIYKSCCDGPYEKGVQRKVATKYLCGLLMEWSPESLM